ERVDDSNRPVVERFEVIAAIHIRKTHRMRSLSGCLVAALLGYCCYPATEQPPETQQLCARGRAAALRRDRFLFGVVDLEHRVELRELEQLHDPLGRIDEDQLSILGRKFSEVADELTDAGGIDVIDLREIDDDVGALVL